MGFTKLDLPEHDKLEKVKDKSQAIGEFLEWLRGAKKIRLCRWNTYEEPNYDKNEPDFNSKTKTHTVESLDYVTTSIEQLLAEFFEIDLNKIEEENRVILDDLRKQREADDKAKGTQQ